MSSTHFQVRRITQYFSNDKQRDKEEKEEKEEKRGVENREVENRGVENRGVENREAEKKKQEPFFSIGEKDCKEIAEAYFGLSFRSSVRDLNWLINVTGYPLEIDIYNDNLKIGIEYNGEQHYRFTPVFHQTIDKFKLQTHRDAIKRFLCKENGIYLITVPYSCMNRKSYLLNEFRKYEEHHQQLLTQQRLTYQQHITHMNLVESNIKLKNQIELNDINNNQSTTDRQKRADRREVKRREMLRQEQRKRDGK